MRVAVIAKAIGEFGGAEKVTQKVVEYLSERHEVKVITMLDEDSTDRGELGIMVDKEWSKSAAANAVKFDPDVIYVCSYWCETAPLYVKNYPVVTMHHDTELEALPISDKRRELLFKLTKIRIEKSDAIIVPSRYVMNYLSSRFYARKDKIFVCPPGFDRVEGEMRERYSKRYRKRKVVLYVGRIAPNKGVHILIQAVREISRGIPVKLKIAGSYTKDYTEYYASLRDIWDETIFLGKLTREEVFREMISADVIVCPSLAHEGFGIVPVEAMYYNGIVVATDIFEKTGAVSRDSAIICRRGSVSALREAITSALTMNEREREKLRARARSYASKFTWERHGRCVERILFRFSRSSLLSHNCC